MPRPRCRAGVAGGGGHEKKGVRRVANQRARVCQHAGRRGPAIGGPHVTPGLGPLPIQKPELQRNCP